MSVTAHGETLLARRRGWRLTPRLLRLAPDERLVDLLRGGSEAAFEVLYARHHRGVLAFCRHMLGSVEEAEDAVQQTFLAAFHDVAGSSKEIHWRPWLYAIARNRCLSLLRARRERVADSPAEPSTEHLSHEVERRYDLRALLGDLAGLPHDQRAALVLAELGDVSHDEIGQVLGCPREKVKALVFQARSSLIASRAARETPCAEVREQLANLRGGALRRTTLRRHLRECRGCREFCDHVRAQRRALALILPVAPSVGLQVTVFGAGGAATGSLVAKTAVVLTLAGGGMAAVDAAPEPEPRRAERPAPAAGGPAAPPPAAAVVAVAGDAGRSDGPVRAARRPSGAPVEGAATTAGAGCARSAPQGRAAASGHEDRAGRPGAEGRGAPCGAGPRPERARARRGPRAGEGARA